MKRLISFLIILPLLAIGCNAKNSSSSREAPSQKKPESVLDVPPESMRDFLADAYRLQPDRRFLMAVAEAHAFLYGQRREKVSAVFKSGQWEICYRNKVVGTLPELPDFKDAMTLLSQWVKTLQQRYPLNLALSSQTIDPEIDRQREKFLAPNVATAMQKTDAAWEKGRHSQALLYSGTRSLVFLAVQGMDRMETADILPAKALALLAITKTLTGYNVDHEESLLAYTLGYSGHAIAVGNKLMVTDAVRLYVNREGDPLKKIAEAPGASAESRYLYLLRLVESKKAEAFLAWAKDHFSDTCLSLPVYKAGLDLNAFSLTPIFAEALPRLVLLSLAQEVESMPDLIELAKNSRNNVYSDKELKDIILAMSATISAKQSTMIDHFESGLRLLEKKYTGPFLDAETYKAYYTGYFFSSLHDLGLHYLDELSSVESAKQYAAMLGKTDTGIAADFRQWYHTLSQSKEGKSSLQVLMSDLEGLRNLGARPLMRTFGEQRQYFSYGDPAKLKAIKLLMTRLDTRIEHRGYLINMAWEDLHDLKLTERLIGTIATAAPTQEEYTVWYADFVGNPDMLKEILRNTHATVIARLRALWYLEKGNRMEKKAVESEYEQLVRENPDNWDIRADYAHYLNRTKQYRKTRTVVQDWQKRKVPVTGLERVFAQTMIAYSYYKEGNYNRGWTAIQPMIESRQRWAMEVGALLLDKLDRKSEAEKMGIAMVERYPDSFEGRMTLTELYWHHGKYAEAATLLKSAPHEINVSLWQFTIAPRFAKVFKDKPRKEVMAAFLSLREQKFSNIVLLRLTYPLEKAGKHDLSFAMSNQLQSAGLERVVFLLQSFRSLKSYKGKQKALEWLRKAIPAGMLLPSSMVMYDEKEYELLWDIIADPGQRVEGSYVWLERAAASLQIGAAKDPHRNELLNHFSKAGTGLDETLGKFLVGMSTEKDVLSLIKTAKERCEVAYFLGLKAQSEGRYQDASDWYRIAVETGLIKNGECRWAHDMLYQWYTQGKSLTWLAADKL